MQWVHSAAKKCIPDAVSGADSALFRRWALWREQQLLQGFMSPFVTLGSCHVCEKCLHRSMFVPVSASLHHSRVAPRRKLQNRCIGQRNPLLFPLPSFRRRRKVLSLQNSSLSNFPVSLPSSLPSSAFFTLWRCTKGGGSFPAAAAKSSYVAGVL